MKNKQPVVFFYFWILFTHFLSKDNFMDILITSVYDQIFENDVSLTIIVYL